MGPLADGGFGWGRFFVRARWVLIAAWLILLALAQVQAPKLNRVVRSEITSVPGSESARVRDLLQRETAPDRNRLAVIFRARHLPTGHPRFQQAVRVSLSELIGQPGISLPRPERGEGPIIIPGRDGRSALALFEGRGVMGLSPDDLVRRYREALRRGLVEAGMVGEMEVLLTGEAVLDADIRREMTDRLAQAELLALPVVFLVLLLVLGSPTAAVLLLAVGMAGVSVAAAAVYLLALHRPVDYMAPNAVTMIGLALGIDYSLLMVSRFREEMGAGGDVGVALSRTMATAGKAVLTSGFTVLVSLGALQGVNSVSIRSLGLATAAAVSAAILSALTLLPAVLSILGSRIAVRRAGFILGALNRIQDGWVRTVMRRPGRAALVSAGILVVLTLPLLQIRTGVTTVGLLPPQAEARRAQDALAAGFAAGVASPIVVVLEGGDEERVVPTAHRFLFSRLQGNREVAAVMMMPLSTPGLAVLEVVSRTGPDAVATRRLVEDIRRDLAPVLARAAGVRVMVGGLPAELVDLDREMGHSLPRLMAGVVAVTGLILLLALRSLLLPLKAAVMNLLSVLAAYGLLVQVFQHGMGADLLGLSPPGLVEIIIMVYMFATVYGIGMDYEIFLLTRMGEAYRRTGDNNAGVAEGLSRTTGVITGAAAVMLAVFGAFFSVGLLPAREFGFGMAAAVFLDVTLVRLMLAPALMVLLGRWNWWLPGRLGR